MPEQVPHGAWDLWRDTDTHLLPPHSLTPELLPLPASPCCVSCAQGRPPLCSGPLKYEDGDCTCGAGKLVHYKLVKHEAFVVDQSAVAFLEVRYWHEVAAGVVAAETR